MPQSSSITLFLLSLCSTLPFCPELESPTRQSSGAAALHRRHVSLPTSRGGPARPLARAARRRKPIDFVVIVARSIGGGFFVATLAPPSRCFHFVFEYFDTRHVFSLPLRHRNARSSGHERKRKRRISSNHDEFGAASFSFDRSVTMPTAQPPPLFSICFLPSPPKKQPLLRAPSPPRRRLHPQDLLGRRASPRQRPTTRQQQQQQPRQQRQPPSSPLTLSTEDPRPPPPTPLAASRSARCAPSMPPACPSPWSRPTTIPRRRTSTPPGSTFCWSGTRWRWSSTATTRRCPSRSTRCCCTAAPWPGAPALRCWWATCPLAATRRLPDRPWRRRCG